MIIYRNWNKLLLIRMNSSKENKYTFLFDKMYYWIIYFPFSVYFHKYINIHPHFIVGIQTYYLIVLSKHNLLKKKPIS